MSEGKIIVNLFAFQSFSYVMAASFSLPVMD